MRLRDEGRAALHADCPHLEIDCPIEAAETAATAQRPWFTSTFVAVGWLPFAVVAQVAPNVRWQSADDLASDSAGPRALGWLFLVGLVATIGALADAYLGARQRTGSVLVAASGPHVNPWATVIAADYPRKPRLHWWSVFVPVRER